jgi:hypothetical protein
MPFLKLFSKKYEKQKMNLSAQFLFIIYLYALYFETLKDSYENNV